MDQATHNQIVSFIWGIADDVLRDLFKRGKYPDVILPMCVIRRMDAVLEPTKKRVLETREMLDKAGITEQRAALCDAAGKAFYNTSKFTLRDLTSRGNQQQLLADFEDYLNGFSPNVQDILDNFKFRNQLPTLSKADAIGTLINKFLDPDIDLSPAGIDNHSMGTVFEELVRKFNEENNEEAGEHWTPRDAVRLMANLVFMPIESEIRAGTYLLYDCACGTGGMLTVAEKTLKEIAARHNQQVTALLYGQEINPETYAVCKADMLLKGEGESADHIVGGAEWSTLSHDAFPAQEFDFMLANPPYGKSWKKDLETMGGKDGMRDPRFKVMHEGEELSLVTRSSDGQMLFLANMASKMPEDSCRLLTSYRECETREDSWDWLDRVAEMVVDMAQPLPETVESWDGERGMCPLCGGGSDSYYEQGFKLPEGLRRHLVGYGRTRQCVFTETAHKLALDDWFERFHEAEENQRVEHENKRQQRRSTETTYQVDPFGPPKLLEEDAHSVEGARTSEQMLLATMRLEELGLEKRFSSNVEAWVDERPDWIVYADPRTSGRIDFTVWKKPLPKRRPVRSYNYRIQSFYLLDSWKNDLKKKYESRLPGDE